MAPLTGSGFTRLGDPSPGALGAFALRSCCIYFTGASTSLFLWFPIAHADEDYIQEVV
jgi:hypothetical protein